MVLFNGCACCASPCGALAWRLLQTSSVEMSVVGTDFERRAVCSVKFQSTDQFGNILKICNKYEIPNEGSVLDSFKGSQYTGTFSLSLSSAPAFVFGGVNNIYRYYTYYLRNSPYACGGVAANGDSPTFEVRAHITYPIGQTVSPGTVSLVSIAVTIFAFGNVTTDRSSASAPAPTDCTSVPNPCANNDPNPKTFYTPRYEVPYQQQFFCNDTFQFSNVTGQNTVDAVDYLAPANVNGTPFGSDTRGFRYASWDSQTGTGSATMTFSNLVVP
jgi:hypothetical protein